LLSRMVGDDFPDIQAATGHASAPAARPVEELDQRMGVVPKALVDVSLGETPLGHA
jgi:hypothetical protein